MTIPRRFAGNEARWWWSIFSLALLVGAARRHLLCAQPDANPSLTGGWAGRGQLAEHGVVPFAEWTTEAWGNVAGGRNTGAWWNSLLDFGVALDTPRLGWWEGGRFMVQAHWVQNLRNDICFDEYTGAFNPVSGVMAGDHLRVFNLYYAHRTPGRFQRRGVA
jgi:hypothetical protein